MTFKAYQLKLDWSQELPLYWFDNSPFKTHFMNSLSTRFFYGEKFFIDTMHKFKNEIVDENLNESVVEFIKQEAIHRVIHKQFDDWLIFKGYDINELTHLSTKQIDNLQRKLSNQDMLMITLCLEHLTTIFAEFFLKNPELFDQMHPHFHRLWKWHAIEEVEHKAVAYELLMTVKNKFLPRRLYSIIVTSSIFTKILLGTFMLLKHDKQLWKWRTFKDAWLFLFNLKNGFITRNIFPYLRIMKLNFSPRNIDHSKLLSGFQK